MSKYQEFIDAARKDDSTIFSKNKLVGMATAMFNDADCEFPIYVKKGDTYAVKPMYPSRNLRENLIAPIVKSFGVDRADLARISEVQTSQAGGEALADFALLLVKEYISNTGLGRKLTLPMTSPKEAVQSISVVTASKDERATTAIVHNADDSYSTVPTGKVVTTESHDRLKVANRVPVWLKSTTAAK